jgi:hypothetical protein
MNNNKEILNCLFGVRTVAFYIIMSIFQEKDALIVKFTNVIFVVENPIRNNLLINNIPNMKL